MKAWLTAMTTAGAVSMAVVAGCGTTSPSGPGSHKPAGQATHAATATAAVAASSNERRLAYWLAATSQDPAALASAISGPVMQSYVQFEASLSEASAAAGSPDSAETVSPIPGGYQNCGTDSSGKTVCDKFTGFRTDRAGRITDLAVDGQLVSARLAVGAPARGSQIAISDVIAYRVLAIGEVIITYHARNITNHVFGNGNPAFLTVFDPSGSGQFQQDDNNSTIPGNLQPGESDIEYAAFATHTVTGQFSLRSNDGYEAVLAATTLRMPDPPIAATPAATARSISPAPAASFICKVLQTNTGEEFNVTTAAGGAYQGTIYVSFFGQPGSGDIFPNTTIHGATAAGTWRPVPPADIGASAEPVRCTAATG